MIIKQNNGSYQTVDLTDLKGVNFDNEIVNKLMPFFYIIVVIVAIFIYLFKVAGFFLAALLYSLIGMIVNSATHMNLRYAAIFKAAIYSQITIAILSALIKITPLKIPGIITFPIALLVTSAYMVIGTLSHNSEEAYAEAGFTTPPPYNN
jgi:hypothetical protein